MMGDYAIHALHRRLPKRPNAVHRAHRSAARGSAGCGRDGANIQDPPAIPIQTTGGYAASHRRHAVFAARLRERRGPYRPRPSSLRANRGCRDV